MNKPWRYDEAENTPNEMRLRSLLVGRRIVSVEQEEQRPSVGLDPVGVLTLDNGTVLEVCGNDGGCSCNAGCYTLDKLAAFDNVITNVETEEKPDGDDINCPVCIRPWCDDDSHEKPEVGFYKVHVFSEDVRQTVADFRGDDGNGYYGTGWWLRVRTPSDR